MKEKQFFIFIGRSGCGKGTQAQLLKQTLESDGYDDVLHVTTGGTFREMMQRPEYIPTLSKEIDSRGGLMPEFLAVWNWSNIFVDKLKSDTSVILDGAPRRMHEANILTAAIDYLQYKSPIVVHINVGETWAKDRLLARGRADDIESAIQSRMDWFAQDVQPVLDYYKTSKDFKYIEVNGEDSVEKIHKALMEKLGN
jgi:adenylate kinase family enzyme